MGTFHNPEFTIVEWYGVGDSYEVGIQLLSDLTVALTVGAPLEGKAFSVTPEKLSYQAAFQLHLGLDPHQADVATMHRACLERGLVPPASLDPQRPRSVAQLFCLPPALSHI